MTMMLTVEALQSRKSMSYSVLAAEPRGTVHLSCNEPSFLYEAKTVLLLFFEKYGSLCSHHRSLLAEASAVGELVSLVCLLLV